jgi:hypothetical protein
VIDTTNLEGSIWTWWREDGKFYVEKQRPSRRARDQAAIAASVAGLWRGAAID